MSLLNTPKNSRFYFFIYDPESFIRAVTYKKQRKNYACIKRSHISALLNIIFSLKLMKQQLVLALEDSYPFGQAPQDNQEDHIIVVKKINYGNVN